MTEARCNHNLRAENRVIPRTCAKCRLGPCAVYPHIKDDVSPANQALVHKIEELIHDWLVVLEQATGKSIDHVSVDTRNFGRLAVEITLTSKRRE